MEDKTFLAVAVDSKPSLLLLPDKKKMKKPASLPVVQLVSSWALYFAFLYGSIGAHHIYADTTCDQSSWWTSCYFLEGAAADEVTKLGFAVLWCSAVPAATAVLALLLACRRCRTLAMAFAFVALALTAANHCMMSRVHYLFLTAYPWDPLLIFGILVAFFVIFLDLLGFLIIIILGRDDQE